MSNNKTNPKVINLSFKESVDDAILWSWLGDKFEEYGSKSGYIKRVLREKMKEEMEKDQQLN